MAQTTTTTTTPVPAGLAPVVGLIGERLVPGGSLLLQGRVGEGLTHTALGVAAQAFFGLPGLLLVAANSFARSQTGQNLTQLITPTTT